MNRDDASVGLRTPPHSREAEQSVLGGLLHDCAARDRIDDLIVERDFYAHEHRLIFAAIGDLVANVVEVDVVTLHERLRALGQDEHVGGLNYLNALAVSVPSASNIRRYAEIVREHAVLRQLIAASDAIATAAYNPKGRNVALILEEANTAVGAIAPPKAPREGKLLTDLSAELFQRMRELQEVGGARPGLPTGLPTVDRVLNGGMKPSWVVVLAARPAVGKTSLAAHLALRAAEVGPVLVLSLEMRDSEIALRMLANAGRIDQRALLTARLADDDWRRLSAASDEVRRLQSILIDDEPALTLPRIVAKVRRAKQRQAGLALVVVDYVQLAQGTDPRANRTLQLGDITAGLKRIAKAEGVAVLLLSQLNRAPEMRADAEPQLSDLRDSGAIEQDADVVLMVWPLDKDKPQSTRQIGARIAKNRHGEEAALVLEFTPSTGAWHESTMSLREAKRDRRPAWKKGDEL